MNSSRFLGTTKEKALISSTALACHVRKVTVLAWSETRVEGAAGARATRGRGMYSVAEDY